MRVFGPFLISLGALLCESYGRIPTKQCVKESVFSEAQECEKVDEHLPMEDAMEVPKDKHSSLDITEILQNPPASIPYKQRF